MTHQSARSTRLFRKIMTKGTLDRNEYFKEPSFSGQLSFSSNAFVDSLEGKIFEVFQNKSTFGFVCCPLIFFNNVAQATEDYHICDIH